ncbi:hypothetical protein EK21DRAFT_80527 [Setomelanomma holmii]|uniref:DJ-1/PfpI domain-containing protein n=1 Tax=Setomelanomma holmii TaxID=210430 RepID=A0A9P4LGW3_9PLEO|nr:hypothetical protein EK21DRAFT_80527 [Setomelanomma holmii]
MSVVHNTQKPLRIGVFCEEVQMTDFASLDLFGNLTPKIIDVVAQLQPNLASLKSLAVPIEFLYISSSADLAWCTPEMYVKPTHTYENAPCDLDILLICQKESLTYLREASKQTKVKLTVCIGGIWLARNGVLNGKKATTNRVMLDMAKQMFPDVEWLDQRWVVDDGHSNGAQIWTAGGAGCDRSSMRVHH